MGTLQTQHDMTLSFYNEFGNLNIYAKQYDTQRYIRFEFTEDVIPENLDNFYGFIRGKFSDGSYIPIARITGGDNEVGRDYILFHIPEGLLAVPGKTVCDLVLCQGDPNATINPDGTVVGDIKIISTHQFSIFVEAMASSGAHLSQHDRDDIAELTRLLVAVKPITDKVEDYNDAETRRNINENGGTATLTTGVEYSVSVANSRVGAEAIRIANETARQEAEALRESAEQGYLAQTKSYAIGDETARVGSSEDNAKYYYEQTKDAVYGKGFMRLSVDADGHLIYERTDDLDNFSFTIDNDKDLILTLG